MTMTEAKAAFVRHCAEMDAVTYGYAVYDNGYVSLLTRSYAEADAAFADMTGPMQFLTRGKYDLIQAELAR